MDHTGRRWRVMAGRTAALTLAGVLLGLLLGGCRAVGAAGLGTAGGGPLFEKRITIDGRERTYLVHLPLTALEGPLPVLIVLHGGGGSGEQLARVGFNAPAGRAGFLVLYPNGTPVPGMPRSNNWNDGRPDLFPASDAPDDVAFITAMLDQAAADHNADPHRVYVAGVSNGGMMAYWLACELGGRVRAIGVVATTMTLEGCAPAAAVSVLHIHGTADSFVLYEGGPGRQRARGYESRPVRDVIAFWREVNGCTAAPAVTVDESAAQRVTAETYTCDRDGSEVALYTVEGGGHGWPPLRGASQAVDPPILAPDATAVIWAFLARH